MEELKPCPFCGGKAYMKTIQAKRRMFTKAKDYPYIRCVICHTSTAACFTEEEAIEAWNARVDHDKL